MILQKNHTDYERGRIPGIVCSQQGSLLAYYECRKAPGDWAQIDLKIQKSTDGGESWREVLRINGQGQTLNNPVMFVKGDRLHLLYCENYRRIFRVHSDDDGESWSAPVEITDAVAEVPHSVVALGPGHGIVTLDGTLVVPMWFALNEDPKAHHPSFISSLYSGDGETWRVGEIIRVHGLDEPSECAMALLTDGWVILSIRNENACKRRCFAVSPTGYSDWDGFQFDDRFPDPTCQGSMAGTPRILCHINCESTEKRENLTLKVSRDGFASFKSYRIAEKGGYADLCIRDGKVCILYETNTTEGMDLVFTTVDL